MKPRRSGVMPLGGKGGNGHSVLLAGSLFVVENSQPILGGRVLRRVGGVIPWARQSARGHYSACV